MWTCNSCGKENRDDRNHCWSCSSLAVAVEGDMWKCVNCGKSNRDNRQICWNCETGKDGSPPGSQAVAEIKKQTVEQASISDQQSQSIQSSRSTVAESREALSLMGRYRDAYIYARFIVGVGTFIKGVGITLAILLFLVLSATGSIIKTNPLISLFTGVIIGGGVGVFFYIWGILISAVGQILTASLDSAVNVSPFLTDKQRARIMSL